MKSTETILAEIQLNLEHLEENQKKCFKEIKEQISKSEEKAQKQLDNHCPRIRDNTRRLAVVEIEIKPIKRIYNKITDFVVGLMIIIGALAVGLIYFLKDKLS